MAKKSATPPKEHREQMQSLVEKARAGELKWLDKVIRDAGYGDPPGAMVIITSRQLEKGLGIARRTLQQYITEGMPLISKANGNRPATFDAYAVLRWLREFWQRVAQGGMEETEAIEYSRRKRKAELIKAEADAELKQKESDIKFGRLVNRDKVVADVNEILRLLQAKLGNCPAEIAAAAVGKPLDDIAGIVREHIRNSFNAGIAELRRALPEKKER